MIADAQIGKVKFLQAKLANKCARVDKRYKFYEMKNKVDDFGISTPEKLNYWQSTIGWCAKAVDSLADRLSFKGFDNDNYNINQILSDNNKDILFDSAILEALIASCSFVAISKRDKDVFLEVYTAMDATGEIDPRTGLLKYGYAVCERNNFGAPTTQLYFEPFKTYVLDGKCEIRNIISHEVPYPLLVPIINRPDAKRPFGHSRITRACMDYAASAIRTIKRSEISAEFYSFPQKYVIGLPKDVEIDKWKSSMAYMMTIKRPKNPSTENPVVGQFTQQSMSPHIDQLKMFASLFAGESGLTMDDLGFSAGNHTSAEAIKASHNQMMLTAMKCQKKFGSGFLNVGYLAACLRDGFPYERKNFSGVTPVWEPLFIPDSAMLSGLGDGIIKINQAIPGYFGKDNVSVITGIDSDGGDNGRYSSGTAKEDTESV